MPQRKSSPAVMTWNHPPQAVTPLDLLRGHIKSCIATYEFHGVIAAEDLRRATARWPELRRMPTGTALKLALYRLEKLQAELAAEIAAREQAPAMVIGTGGAQPVPPQAPAPRAQPVPV